MIAGSFSVEVDVLSVHERITEFTECEGMTFHKFILGGFSGGYFLHQKLPYEETDFYFLSKVNDVMVLLSGCLYNKDELLELCGIKEPIPDPELIGCLYMREGPDFVKRLNGDFSIFIQEPNKRRAFLYRDQLGIRPLAYTSDLSTLFFSSDIRGLCRHFSYGGEIEREYLLAYFKYVDYRRNPEKRVKKMLPGHYLSLSSGGIKITQYWKPEKIRIDRGLTFEGMLSDLRQLVTDAVKIRCDHRFNAGAHVTGGLDSGMVSSLARSEYAHLGTFYGFSWSPREFSSNGIKYDEREIIISSCAKTGIIPVFSEMNETDFMVSVSDYYHNQGYFSEDKTSDQVTSMGINLIFSGWGGDDFISTGDRGIEIDLLAGLKWKIFFRRNPIRRPKKFIRYLFLYVINPLLGKLDRDTLKIFRDDARYIKKPYKQSDRKAIKNYYSHISRRQLHLNMLRFYHLQERCESWAINGYRRGLEYRYPLLDRRIVEYMLKVPSELLCRTGLFRPLLREIGEGILPEEVIRQFDKSDPVCWAYMDVLFRGAAIKFMEEVTVWKTNPDLQFIDFDLLSEDIIRFRQGPGLADDNVLFRALVYIKAVHEFTKEYHGSKAINAR